MYTLWGLWYLNFFFSCHHLLEFRAGRKQINATSRISGQSLPWQEPHHINQSKTSDYWQTWTPDILCNWQRKLFNWASILYECVHAMLSVSLFYIVSLVTDDWHLQDSACRSCKNILNRINRAQRMKGSKPETRRMLIWKEHFLI